MQWHFVDQFHYAVLLNMWNTSWKMTKKNWTKNLKYVNCYFIYFLYTKVNCDLSIELLLCSDTSKYMIIDTLKKQLTYVLLVYTIYKWSFLFSIKFISWGGIRSLVNIESPMSHFSIHIYSCINGLVKPVRKSIRRAFLYC